MAKRVVDLNTSPLPEGNFAPHIQEQQRNKSLKRNRPDHHDSAMSHQPPPTKSYKPNNLPPPGWLDCPGFGQEIPATCIIPSKVPLSEGFNDYILPGKRYSFKQVIHHQQRILGRKIGLVIDLTNTTRYYNPNDLKKESIQHVKIQCKGRDAVPDNTCVNNFVYQVTQFLSRHQKQYILVHCTHGHNRTGYMIVHHLMRTKLSLSVSQAIKIFAHSRPPGIYKPDYIDALYAFYHERKPETFVCPPTPEWKTSDEAVLEVRASPVQVPAVVMMTNDDVLGDEIPEEQLCAFRLFCYQMLKLNATGRGLSNLRFPGSHPVSVNRENLKLLWQSYYSVTWKADGTRYMMLLTMDGCHLMDRNFIFRRVQMRFPCKSSPLPKRHHYTLLDGEMVIDKLPVPNSQKQQQERRYLIYDMMALNGVSVIQEPFGVRWKMIEEQVIKPRNDERFNNQNMINPDYRYELEPFRVRRKDFWFLTTVNGSTVEGILNKFIPKLSHEADGIIFQSWNDPYVPRRNEALLKWKYAAMNSVDFYFDADDDHQLLFLNENGKKTKLMEGKNALVFKDGSVNQSLYKKKIIECGWDSKEQVWVFMRIRTDKSNPNDIDTYRSVMKSIGDNITEDYLLNEVDNIIRLPMYAAGTR